MAAIIFNGAQYNNPDEMPPEVRQAYEQAMGMLADQDGNGMPDILQLVLTGDFDPINMQMVQDKTTFVYKGQIYASLDDLPLEARQRYEQMGATRDANWNGIPDIFEQNPPPQPSQSAAQPLVGPSQQISYPSIEPEGVNLRGMLTGAAIAVFVMLAIGAALVLSGVIKLP